ncbi:MAG: hypothetical protein ACRBBQ_17130 [Cognatishimia sp.]
MSGIDREDLVRAAVQRHFAEWAYSNEIENGLCLGNSFKESLKQFVQSKMVAVNTISGLLNSFPSHELEHAAGLNGAILEPSHEEMLAATCKTARASLSKYSRYELICLGVYPEELADFSYWANRDRIELEDFVWLSIGLEPSDDLAQYFRLTNPKFRKQNPFVKKEARRRRELFRTAQKLVSSGKTITTANAHEWLQTVDLDVPESFRNALEVGWMRLNPNFSVGDKRREGDETVTENVGPREMRTLAKIITAIAIEEYGYEPNAPRSPIPKEIQDICDKQGLPLSKETVLKYLRIGAKLIEEN